MIITCVAVFLGMALIGGGLVALFNGLIPGVDLAGEPASPTPKASRTQEQSSEPTPESTGTSAEPTVEPYNPEPSPTEPSPTEPPSAAIGYTCWDGSPASDLSGCQAPQSENEIVEYLGYVFPSFYDLSNDCEIHSPEKGGTPQRDYKGRTTYIECRIGDMRAVVRYWELGSDAESMFGDRFEGNTRATYGLAVGGTKIDGWAKTTAKATNDGLNLVGVLDDSHLSVSIFGPTWNEIWDVFAQYRIVPIDALDGYPTDAGPPTAVQLDAVEP
jgi:hypothetical protein